MSQIYEFSDLDERDHRFSRTSTFLVSTTIATLPFFINLIWRLVRGEAINIYEGGITDLTFAGVVVAISTFSNTYFSAPKLAGWRNLSRSTFAALFMVAICAIFSLIAYIQTTHKLYAADLKDEIIIGNGCLTASIIMFSYVAIYSFTSDEVRQASKFFQSIPERLKI